MIHDSMTCKAAGKERKHLFHVFWFFWLSSLLTIFLPAKAHFECERKNAFMSFVSKSSPDSSLERGEYFTYKSLDIKQHTFAH